MGMSIFIACTSALIGSLAGKTIIQEKQCSIENGQLIEKIVDVNSKDGEIKGYNSWIIGQKEGCNVTFGPSSKKKQLSNTIVIECNNGEKFFLPASACSVSIIKDDDK
jgi:hypothetical protein